MGWSLQRVGKSDVYNLSNVNLAFLGSMSFNCHFVFILVRSFSRGSNFLVRYAFTVANSERAYARYCHQC